MPLETATYIVDLNSANPAHNDPLSQDDAHLRLVKSVLKAQFPNFTAAALTSTQAALDAAASASTNGISVLADAGVGFKTNTGDGFTNPAAGEVDVKTGGTNRLKVTAATIQPQGTTVFAGPGCMPIGGSTPWFSNTLPSGFGTFGWLNGQAISRTTYAALFAILGTTYGAGDGTTTFNLPDARDNVLVGKGDMGATTAVGRITNFVSTTLGNLFGACLHTLGITEIPAHSHGVTDPGHVHLLPYSNAGASTGGSQTPTSSAGTVNSASATTGITINNAGGGGSHNNVQPSLVCNWIMRLA